jgi:hypothetical protein
LNGLLLINAEYELSQRSHLIARGKVVGRTRCWMSLAIPVFRCDEMQNRELFNIRRARRAAKNNFGAFTQHSFCKLSNVKLGGYFRWRREPVPPKHPHTMRWALQAAAAVPESVAPAEPEVITIATANSPQVTSGEPLNPDFGTHQQIYGHSVCVPELVCALFPDP